MTRRALIIGGSGQIGQATARRLAREGFEVTAAQRRVEGLPEDLSRLGVRAVRLDRDVAEDFVRVAGAGFDVIIDTVAFTKGHARQLLGMQGDADCLIVISSASVYCDDRGRTLDEAASTGFPDFPGPIGEDSPTVAPSDATYSTRKRALEEVLLSEARAPVSVIRPCAIHGPGSRHPREWWFVRRILDGRPAIPLAYGGKSRFHTSATPNIAELICVCVAHPGTRILNAADPYAPSVGEIGQAIVEHYDSKVRLVPFDGPPRRGVGGNPWSIPGAMVVDCARAHALGYRPVTTYFAALADTCAAAEAAGRQPDALPAYLGAMFDYGAEDAFFGATGPD